jgi:hypothetical protein
MVERKSTMSNAKITIKAAIKGLLQRAELATLRLGISRRMGLAEQMAQIATFRQMGAGLNATAFDVYSPNGEDGILLYILTEIGMTNKRLVDIGAGAVKGSVVANLIVHHGFSGLLLDGSENDIKMARQYYSRHPATKRLGPTLLATFVTMENVNGLIADHGLTGEIDLLSIDIDGVDYWIWKAIEAVQPRVVIVEYQDILGPDRAWTIPYRPDFNARDYPVNREHNNYCGASLRALVNLGHQKGYRLVGCNKGGWNAFFIRNELGEDRLPEVSVESCLQSEWNRFGAQTRFPLVEKMDWQEV